MEKVLKKMNTEDKKICIYDILKISIKTSSLKYYPIFKYKVPRTPKV